VMVAALLLKIVQSYAAQTAARGAAILTVDALNMMLIALLVFLVLRQVMPIASGLAGGASLSSLGIASSSISSGLASFRKNRVDPAMNKVRPHVTGTLGAVVRGSGLIVRDAAAQSRQTLVRNWRNWRR
jgi:hypothetical protein